MARSIAILKFTSFEKMFLNSSPFSLLLSSKFHEVPYHPSLILSPIFLFPAIVGLLCDAQLAYSFCHCFALAQIHFFFSQFAYDLFGGIAPFRYFGASSGNNPNTMVRL